MTRQIAIAQYHIDTKELNSWFVNAKVSEDCQYLSCNINGRDTNVSSSALAVPSVYALEPDTIYAFAETVKEAVSRINDNLAKDAHG